MAAANFATLTTTRGIGIVGLNEPCFVDSSTFLAVLRSLPPDYEVAFEVDGSVLKWDCGKGQSKGRIATKQVDDLKPLPSPTSNSAFSPPEGFGNMLALGGLSCDQPVLMTLGLYGVVIDSRHDELLIYSTDNNSISVYRGGEPSSELEGMITLAPEVAEVIAAINEPDAVWQAVDDRRWVINGSTYRCLFDSRDLKADQEPVLRPFLEAEDTIPLNKERVANFIRRVNAIAEVRNDLYVEFSVENGAVQLTFDGGTSSSSDYFLVEGSSIPDISPLSLKATSLARALAHVERIALDHVDRQVLSFIGKDDAFSYIICANAYKRKADK